MTKHLRFIATIVALAVLAVPATANAARARAASPRVACTSPSGICAPTEGTTGDYAWQGSATGSQWFDEFTGTTLDANWFAQSLGTPGGCYTGCNDTWNAALTNVGSGQLTVETACDDGTCLSGGIGQNDGGTGAHPWLDDGQVAVTMRVFGSGTAGDFADNLTQIGSYPVWPPEIDVMENGSGSVTSYHSFLHCAPASKAQYQQAVTGVDLSQWQTFEVDWTPTTITGYDTVAGTTTLTFRFVKPTVYNEHNAACYANWPPTPAAAMGEYLQSQLLGSTTPSGLQVNGLDVDWIAERYAS